MTDCINTKSGFVVTMDWAARSMGVSTSAISKWKVDPIQRSPIMYDIRELVSYKVNYHVRLEEAAKKRADGVLSAIANEVSPKDMLYLEQVEAQKIKTAKLRSDLLDKSEVEKVVLSIFTQFRQAVLAVPSRISSQCSASQDRKEAYTILEEEMFLVLRNLASFDISDCHENIDHLTPIEEDETDKIEEPLEDLEGDDKK